MLLKDSTGRVSLAKSTSCSCHRSTILGNQSDGCAAVERLRPGAWNSLPCLGSDASLLLEIAHAVYRLPHWEGGTKKGRFPSQGKRPTRSAERGSKALETCVCGWTTVLRETRIGSCDWVTMRTAADCATGTKNDPAGGAGRPPLPATGGLWRRRLKLLPIAIANGRRGCTHCRAPRCRRDHGGTCSRARRRPLVAHGAGDG